MGVMVGGKTDLVGDVAEGPGTAGAVAVQPVAHHVAGDDAVAVLLLGLLPLDHDLRRRARRADQTLGRTGRCWPRHKQKQRIGQQFFFGFARWYFFYLLGAG